MKAIEKIRISGIVERRPSAGAMPTGIDATMPVTDTTNVTRSPPQSRYRPPAAVRPSRLHHHRQMPMRAGCQTTIAAPAGPRDPPPRKNSSSDTIAAVSASRFTPDGSTTEPAPAARSAAKAPGNHRADHDDEFSDPPQEQANHSRRLAGRGNPPSPMLSLRSGQQPVIQLTAKPLSPPPYSRKKATTGKAKERWRLIPPTQQP